MHDIDLINYKYAFAKSLILWYISFNIILNCIFHWKFNILFLLGIGLSVFGAIISQSLYEQILMSKKLKKDLFIIFSIDILISVVASFIFGIFYVLKFILLIWLLILSSKHDIKT